MIHLKFSIVPNYLIWYTLVNCDSESRFISGQPTADVVAFQNRAWELDKDAYRFLQDGITARLMFEDDAIIKLSRRANDLLNKLPQEKAYKPIINATMEAQEKMRHEWEEDLGKSYSWMCEMMGIPIDIECEVFITHPSIKNGTGSNKKIYWTYRQDFPHYNTIYLWHETLHSILPSQSKDQLVNLEHAVIELLTDNEMRVLFNKGEYPPLIGHSYLEQMETKMIPLWREYLKSSNKNIKTFIDEVRKKLKIAD